MDLTSCMHVAAPPPLPNDSNAGDLKEKIDVRQLFSLLDGFDNYYKDELLFERLTHGGGYASVHVSS